MVPTRTTCCNIYNFPILPRQWICSVRLLQTTAIMFLTSLTGLCRGDGFWSLRSKLNSCIHLEPEVYKFSKNLAAISKFQAPEAWHEATGRHRTNLVATANRCSKMVHPWFKLIPIFKGSCRLFRTVWWRQSIIHGITQGRPGNRTSTSPHDRIPQVVASTLVLSF